MMSYLPEIYKDFKKQFPEVAQAYVALGNSCNKQGPLDKRCQRLIKLGIAIGINSEGGVRSHARRALEEGISADEIRHAVLMATTTAGFSTMIASMKWVEEVIKKSK
jgi:alkylhydroperoxidase/carboxymuconolactone decarboxylase family protein YurZ